jgi:hypothetical protein
MDSTVGYLFCLTLNSYMFNVPLVVISVKKSCEHLKKVLQQELRQCLGLTYLHKGTVSLDFRLFQIWHPAWVPVGRCGADQWIRTETPYTWIRKVSPNHVFYTK